MIKIPAKLKILPVMSLWFSLFSPRFSHMFSQSETAMTKTILMVHGRPQSFDEIVCDCLLFSKSKCEVEVDTCVVHFWSEITGRFYTCISYYTIFKICHYCLVFYSELLNMILIIMQ